MNLNTAELERLIPGLECGFNDDDDSSPTNTTISWTQSPEIQQSPEHEFVKYTKVVQTGKTKGQTRHCVSLAQHLYICLETKTHIGTVPSIGKNWAQFLP